MLNIKVHCQYRGVIEISLNNLVETMLYVTIVKEKLNQ
jgi:hypothetical protein